MLLPIQTIKSELLNENTRLITNLVFFIYTKICIVPQIMMVPTTLKCGQF